MRLLGQDRERLTEKPGFLPATNDLYYTEVHLKSKLLVESSVDSVGATAIGLDGGGEKDGPNPIASPVRGASIAVGAPAVAGQRGRGNVMGRPTATG